MIDKDEILDDLGICIGHLTELGEQLSLLRDKLEAKEPELTVIKNDIVPPGGYDWREGLKVEQSKLPNHVKIYCPFCPENFDDYDIRYLQGYMLCNCICGTTWFAKKDGQKYLYKLSKEGSDDSANNDK